MKIIAEKGSYNINYPIYRDTPKKYQELLSTKRRFFIVGGTLYFLAESAIYDAYKMFEKSRLFCHKPKVWASKCFEMLNKKGYGIDALIKKDMEYGYELWTDITDTAQDYTKQPLLHLNVAISNYVLNHCKSDVKVKTEMLYSCILYGMAIMFYDDFMEENKKVCGFDFSEQMSCYRCDKTYALWENATLALTRDIDGMVIKDPAVKMAHDAFFSIISGDNWFNNVAKEGMRRNGNYDEVLAKMDEEERIEAEEAEKEKLGINKLKEKFNSK